MDAGRISARAGVPAAARRRRRRTASWSGPQGEARRRQLQTAPRERDRRGARSSSKTRRTASTSRVGDAQHPAHESRPRVLARQLSRAAARDHEARPAALSRRVSPYMLPHLENRPLTMIRMPEGINGERFFQKHWDQERPEFVETVTVFSGHKDEQHDYMLANNLPTLLWLGQVGTLEFHVWHSRAEVGAGRCKPAHRLLELTRRRSKPRCSTTPTTWCSTSTPTSIRARKRKARNRSSTRRASPSADASRSGCATC